MSDLSKLPVTVITGFLGSGKTTLISHLMRKPEGRRLAVVVNEFGDVGVDGEILRGCAIPDCPAENIVELANGCICCTVADDFIPTIEALMALDPRPDHILIETSGLALPKPLLKAFDWPDIRAKITVDGVIALADAEARQRGDHLGEARHRQLAHRELRAQALVPHLLATNALKAEWRRVLCGEACVACVACVA